MPERGACLCLCLCVCVDGPEHAVQGRLELPDDRRQPCHGRGREAHVAGAGVRARRALDVHVHAIGEVPGA